MRIFTLLIALIILFIGSPSITQAQSFEPCVSEIEFQEAAKKDPNLLKIRADLEKETEQYIADKASKRGGGGQTYKIPVVFHIIHTCGGENISKAQILDQLRILNEDFSRTNLDASQTPLQFANVAADAEIEFALAQLDPQGNCTDGINRIYSTLSHSPDPRNSVKSTIYWPRSKYLNIWIVGSIINTSGSGGIILGYAQFPGGSATTDGIVMRADYTGSIGTAANNNNNGRTLTHEVGHWLNLRHIWGDATCGSDFVNDTPTQETSNFGCPSFPHITCGNGPNGDQFMNYMDYTNGNCQNMLSMGQRDRMHAALNSAVSSRNNLWSAANLSATGVDQIPTTCAPDADFCQLPIRICEGDQITFNDNSTNGDVTNWNWSFPGGTPSTSTDQNPMVTYNSHGIYDVTLTVSNASGQTSKTHQKHVYVSRAAAWYTVPFSEGFENILFPGGFWHVENAGGSAWEQTSQAAYSGTQCVKLQNYTGNTQEPDAFITPTYNLSNVSQTMMTFKLAFAARSSTNTDKLQIFASTNCGRTWSLRYTKSGLALATAGLVSSNFIPTNQSQWREETVNFSTSSVSGRDNVMFKFVYTNDSGNNMYIDDINLTGVVGQEEILDELLQLSIYPNPSENVSTVSFNLAENKEMSIYVTDMTGRIVENVEENELSAGDHSYQIGSDLSKGMYFVHLNVEGQTVSKKFVRK